MDRGPTHDPTQEPLGLSAGFACHSSKCWFKHPEPQAPSPKPQTLNPKPQTLNPKRILTGHPGTLDVFKGGVRVYRGSGFGLYSLGFGGGGGGGGGGSELQ